MKTSQPLFGPCVPSRLTGPSLVHVTKTPTVAAATASKRRAVSRLPHHPAV